MIIHSHKWVMIDPNAGGPITPEMAEAGRRLANVVQPPPERANFATKVSRLRAELQAWRASGAKFVSREVRLARGLACEGDANTPKCPYWEPSGNFFLGECTYPGCGCTKGKRALATSICPHQPSKWPL